MLISPAHAQAAGGAAGGSGFEALLPLVLIFIVFYFLLIRPQQKKMKEHKEMIAALRRGDKVVTGGGIMGTVSKVDDESVVTVEIAPDVKVKVSRALISSTYSKSAPVEGGGKDDAKGKGRKDAANDEAAATADDDGKNKSLLGSLLGGRK